MTPPLSQSQHASIPLLVVCTSNIKTVVANPIVYLTNLSHDIIQTITALDSPPHPDVLNNEVRIISKILGLVDRVCSVTLNASLLLWDFFQIYVLHTLAASLSACIYQGLCDGQSYGYVFLQLQHTIHSSIFHH